MKKGIIASILLTVVMLLSGCKAPDKKVVRVVTDPTWPPFEIVDEKTKEIVGFDIDIIKAIAEKEGFEVSFTNLSFDAVIPGVAQCQYDAGISGITINEERSKTMLFSDSYYVCGQILTVKEGNEANNTKDAFKDKIIGGQTGTTGAFMAQEWEKEGFSKHKGYDSIDLAFLDLKNGQIDAVLTDDAIAFSYAKSLGGISPVGELFSTESLGIAVCKTNTELLAKINHGLKTIKEDGTMDKLIQKYFPKADAK